VERAGGLDTTLRKWLQNPVKILNPYIKKGMTVLDAGCGPGFFTIPAAKLVGPSGKVIAADLQDGMLDIVRTKIEKNNLSDTVILKRCEPGKIGYTGEVDVIIAIYVLHELPDHKNFFREMFSILRPGGKFLVLEPKLFHVSGKEFKNDIKLAASTGFRVLQAPGVFISHSALFTK
jgi:ubiquinone/menaquinone biosynthesis C-methylase UbiE